MSENKSSRVVLVVLPTFNELANLEKVVAGVRKLGHDVLVVDDASPDGTGALADRLAAADAGVRVLHRPRKLGLGSAYQDAFQIGLSDGSDLFVEMDADGSHLAANLDAIVAAARDSGGLAIGSRYVAGGEVVGWPFYRWLLSWLANAYCRPTTAPPASGAIRVTCSSTSSSMTSCRRDTRSRSRWCTGPDAWATRWSRRPSASKIVSRVPRKCHKAKSDAPS